MLIAVAFVPKEAATFAEFNRAARSNASAFWMWAVSAGIVWWGASLWWATVPAALVAHSAMAWVRCKRLAKRLEQPERRLPLKEQPAVRSCHSSMRDAA